jgi:DNA invertase Pin-like site-specific DNA recombinase
MSKAISYMRFSASHQEKGSTIERQQERINRWLIDHPEIEESHLSRIDKAASGYKGEHLEQGFGAILRAIETGEIQAGDYLLVEAIDRLGRLPPMDMITLLMPICKAGIIIVTLEDNQEYSTAALNGGGSALFILAGKVQQAYEYSNRLSGRLIEAHKNKRSIALAGGPVKKLNPVWLTSDGKLISEHATMVKACIAEYLKGLGARAIILKLQRQFKHLEGVHPTTLNRWFSNPAIIGEWHTKEHAISNVFEALISNDEYFTLQREIKHRKLTPSPPKTYDLSGILICGKCGRRFHYRRKKHNDYTITYANCSTYLKRGKIYCDNNKTWPYEVLSFVYRETYSSYILSLASRKDFHSNTIKITNLKDELDAISPKINKLKKVAETLGKDLEIVEITNSIREYGLDRRRIEQQIASLKQEELSSEHGVDEVISKYESVVRDPTLRRESLIKLGYKMIVLGDELSVTNLKDETCFIKLLKRSTANNCYFIERSFSEIKRIEKIAINRDGLCAKTSLDFVTWEDFSSNLKDFFAAELLEEGELPPSGLDRM